MPYSIRQSATAVVLVQNGADVLSLDPTINPRLCGHLCTPAFHDGGAAQQNADGSVTYVDALSDAGGKWVIDLVTKRFQCASAALDETAKDEDTREEIEFAVESIKTIFGWGDVKAKAFLQLMRLFVLAILGRKGI